MRLKYEFKELHIASDGWPFYVQEDGTASDTPNPKHADLIFDNIAQLYAFDDGVLRGTISHHAELAQQRIDNGYPCENDVELVLWYRGKAK
tara:strand:- start:150 stop:422 length:273 start_codon:yes stop_codon:yes gene_type:complete